MVKAGHVQRLLKPRRRLHFAPAISGDVRVNRQREMHSSCEGGERRKTGEEQCRPSPSLNSADDVFHPLTTNSRDRSRDEPTDTSRGWNQRSSFELVCKTRFCNRRKYSTIQKIHSNNVQKLSMVSSRLYSPTMEMTKTSSSKGKNK